MALCILYCRRWLSTGTGWSVCLCVYACLCRFCVFFYILVCTCIQMMCVSVLLLYILVCICIWLMCVCMFASVCVRVCAQVGYCQRGLARSLSLSISARSPRSFVLPLTLSLCLSPVSLLASHHVCCFCLHIPPSWPARPHQRPGKILICSVVADKGPARLFFFFHLPQTKNVGSWVR